MKATIRKVSVRNLQRRIPVDVVDLERFAERALKLCLEMPNRTELKQLPEVSVLIVSDRKIAALHQKFMNESGPTDVITFQHGEIFVSAEMAKRNAKRFKNSLERELRLYIVHGLLHLHGFDDRDSESARKMEVVQQNVLAKAEL